eukprot:CAMPEP_0204609578 /NCGR_PEP_ID=MMETSP0661-20131031/61001_1 /ASSEMBLY_ACC=CAM_ASM_000606 /TAXON_ID=109239 /ORGANISM="Alexandrium margalefi, Strain AMGDE01CS-322" /LENGTH=239 /DNA_ID=CAMNT_0051621267 /DNA_START=63 /DNA_END=778 /DNA_ORIENTATION=-
MSASKLAGLLLLCSMAAAWSPWELFHSQAGQQHLHLRASVSISSSGEADLEDGFWSGAAGANATGANATGTNVTGTNSTGAAAGAGAGTTTLSPKELMERSVLDARKQVFPVINPNVSDRVWYKDYYAAPDNALMKLSFDSPFTQPTAAQKAKEQAREKAALKKILPKIKAEEMEADHYYHKVFPYDTNNDLDDWTGRTAGDLLVEGGGVHARFPDPTCGFADGSPLRSDGDDDNVHAR